MSKHIPREELLALAAGDLGRARAWRARRHAGRCQSCRDILSRASADLQRLNGLTMEARPERDLWAGIEARLRPTSDDSAAVAPPPRGVGLASTSGHWRRALATAAGVALFLLGGLLGRFTASVESSVTPAAQQNIALDIQRTGTAYVNEVASLRFASAEISMADRAQAREAAIAAIYGGVRELQLLTPDDPVLADLAELATLTRYGGAPRSAGQAF